MISAFIIIYPLNISLMFFLSTLRENGPCRFKLIISSKTLLYIYEVFSIAPRFFLYRIIDSYSIWFLVLSKNRPKEIITNYPLALTLFQDFRIFEILNLEHRERKISWKLIYILKNSTRLIT